MIDQALHWLKKSFANHSSLVFDLKDFDPPPSTQLLILQPTPFCNLDCDYCYLPNRDSQARMPLDTVRKVAERLKQDQLLGPMLTVVWHAGEPLVMPLEFYQSAFEIFTEVLGDTCQVFHSIQTNATLIDADWCKLFKSYQVRIGVSIDGPEFLHDKHRKTRQGKGSFNQVIKGIQTLQSQLIPFHVISVITADTLPHADELHNFLIEHQIREVGFNFDEAEGLHATSSLADQEQAHNQFYQQMLNNESKAAGRYQIRELATARRLIHQGLPTYRWQDQQWPFNSQTQPFAIITVAWNGDFSTFSPELLGQPSPEFNHFVLGNISDKSFLGITTTPLFLNLWQEIQLGTETCKNTCAYFNYCGGGAPANKLYENGTLNSGETLYCRSMLIRPFESVLKQLEQQNKYSITTTE
jgi:uncharacterized protein